MKQKVKHQASGSAQKEVEKQAALYKGMTTEPRRSGRQ